MVMWPWRRSARPLPVKRPTRPRPGSAPPACEQLEDRLAPAGGITANLGTPAAPNLVTHLVLPAALGNQTASTLYVQYSNTGTAPLAAPLLTLSVTQLNTAGVAVSQALLTLNPSVAAAGPASASSVSGFTHSVQILASGATPGVLRPGESESVPVYWDGWQQPWNPANAPFQFTLSVTQANDTTAINWTTLQSALQPVGVSASTWAVIYGGMTSRFGTTAGSYVQQLDADASYLGSLGENVTDVSQLWGLEVTQSLGPGFSLLPDLAAGIDVSLPAPGLPLIFSRTFSNSLLGRTQAGPLGYGWFDNWQTSLTVTAGGAAIVSGDGGAQQVFQPDGNGGYTAPPGDFDTLTGPGSGGVDYLLRGQNGVVTAFLPTGAIDYVQDLDGNTIRAGYDGAGRLISLSHSSGQTLRLSYNGAGRIASVTESAGGQTLYTYDASNRFLIAVTGSDGRTVRYTYDTSTGTATSGALLSVAYPDGTHDLFTYDGQGRLSTTAHDGGAEKQTWTYGAGGLVSITDANGNTSQYFFDDRALVRTVDPLGNATTYGFDGRLDLVSVTNALGQVTANTYDANGFLTSSTDPNGDTVSYAYTQGGPAEEMASVTDANGNTTSYRYDPQGNLLAISYPDSAAQQFSYDPLGNAIGAVDANGNVTCTAYNASGQVAAQTFADGSSAAFVYGAAGDLLSATTTAADGTTATTSYTYATGSHELVMVSYANGLSLQFSYDAGGRRTQSVDQNGFTVNYQYDAVGRLARLSDAGGRTVVSYTYDAGGRLIEKDLGNGTYTTYQYDAAGNLARLVNYGPRPRAGQSGPVNSSFAYAYDALGRMTSMTTAAGTWSYAYDNAGRLASALFAGGSSVIPSQTLVYVYDAAGNRTATVVNGVTTNYTTNSRGQYVSAGATSYSYDANGNLTAATGPGGTTTYAYNAANQLIGVTAPDGTTWTYTYDAAGHPIAVTSGGQTTDYLYDPVGLGYVVGSYTTSGGLVADYAYGLGLTSQVTGTGASYYDFDATGATVGLTGAAGTYVAQYGYQPYGVVTSATGSAANPFTFQGQSGAFGPGGGVLSMGGRAYLPSLGRFMSPDSLGVVAGGANLLEYAADDPLNLAQPTGLTVMRAVPWNAAGSAHAAIELSGQNFAQYVVPESRQDDLFDAPLQAAYWSRGQEHAPPRQALSLEMPDDMGQAMAARALVQQAAGAASLWGYEAAVLRGAVPSVPGNLFFPGYLNVFLHTATAAQSYGQNTVVALGSGTTGTNGSSSDFVSLDDVSSVGTTGYGTQNFVAEGTLLAYRVNFENDPASTLPAQQVTVTDPIDPSLDWTTFQFTEVGFGNTLLTIPAGSQEYDATVPMTYNGVTFDVEIELTFNQLTGLAVAVFTSLDPATGLPPDVTAGFLPPEDGSGRGTGHVSFTALPRPGLPTGTQIRNIAYVSIGSGPVIRTDQVNDGDATQGIDTTKEDLVTIDSDPPQSAVLPLPAVQAAATFTLNWWGQDVAGGSGIAYFDVYYSDNGGAFQPLLRHTTLTSTTFRGAAGHSYAFYSVATDNVGNVQATPATAQATTRVQMPTTLSLISSAVSVITYGQAVTFTAAVGVTAPAVVSSLAGETITFWDGSTVLGTGTLNAQGVATLSVPALGAGLHAIAATYGGDAADQGATAVLRGGLVVNRALPAFTRVTASQSIMAGTASITLSGVLAAATAIPVGQSVTITVGGVTTTAVIGAGGSFSAVLNTAGLAASTAPYTIVYSYAGSPNFNLVMNYVTSLTVTARPADVSSRVLIRPGSILHVNGTTSRSPYNYAQTITITNTSGASIAGPLYLQLVGLTNATLYNRGGTSLRINAGTPYLMLGPGSLAPGASITVTLYFAVPTINLPRYTAHLISGGLP